MLIRPVSDGANRRKVNRSTVLAPHRVSQQEILMQTCLPLCQPRRRQLLRGGSVLLLAPSLLLASARASASQPVTKASRVRMLAQRVGKLCVQQAVDVRTERARTGCESALQEGTQILADLKRAPSTPELGRSLAVFEAGWKHLASEAVQPQNTKTALGVLRLSDENFDAGNQMVSLYAATASHAFAKLLNTCGRQRGLSQRMAANYFAWKLTNENAYSSVVSQTRETFKSAFDQLLSAPISTPQIRNELQLAQGQWLFMDQALSSKAPAAAVEVATTSDRLLEVFDSLIELYDQTLASLS
jgi:hypothetical protein